MQMLQEQDGADETPPTIVRLRAGDCVTVSQLVQWLSHGKNSFASTAGAEIMPAMQQLATLFPRPLLIYNTEVTKEDIQHGVPSLYTTRGVRRYGIRH